MEKSPLIPYPATITDIIDETSDVKTFQIVFDNPEVQENFQQKPGQIAQLSVFGKGEAPISITSSPTRKGILEFSVKKVGKLTSALHEMDKGSKVGIRGPYGNNFPYEEMKGKDILFIGGGIGLAPLRSLIDFVLDEENRDSYGHVSILYGARSTDDLCFKRDLFERWPQYRNTDVYTTIDRPEEGWKGHVGFVPSYLEDINPAPENKVTVTCGPPIMIKFVLQALAKMGYTDDQIVTTLELKMKCGVGKCGRCNIGKTYVCMEGPVFTMAQIKQMPPEF